jgi:hypothetical protein
MTDLDGTISYSEYIYVRIDKLVNTDISIYPNTALDEIQVSFNSIVEEGNVLIKNYLGQNLRNTRIKNADRLVIPIYDLPAGIY